MKHPILLCILFSWISCIQQQELAKNAGDKQTIIYDIIYRSLTQQDMPAFTDLKGRKIIYVHNRYVNFINSAATDNKPLIDKADIPEKVKGHTIQLISENDLKKRAFNTGVDEFMLVLGNIKIEGDTATIAIDGWYRNPQATGGSKMSGGGGFAKYSKEKGVWVFKGFSQVWIS
jgi:hypothetical protein